MKKKIKLLAIILTVLITVLCLPINALASDISDVEETSHEESTSIEAFTASETEVTSLSELLSEVLSETTESSVETTVETETMKFLFTEEETLPTNSRMIGGGGEVDFGPPEEEATGIIPDGVYAIENFAYPGIWMDVSSATSADHMVWQENFAQNPKDSFNRSALFKITYVPATNSYTIRLMTNNLLSLTCDSYYVYTAAISPFDEIGTGKLSASSTFTITYSLGGYIISPYGDSAYAICSRGNAAGEAYGSGASLARDLISDAGNNARWRFHRYTGENQSEITVSYATTWRSVGIPVGTKGTMGCTSWSTIIGANTPYKRVAAASSAMVSTSFNFTTGKMSFEALNPGSATIYSMILEGTSEPSKYTTYYNYTIIPQEGTYLIRNVGTEKYIDIEGHTTEENAIIQQFKYGDADWLKWSVEHVSNGQGYVRIRSKHSQKYISVDSTDSTVIKQTSTLNNYSLWKFERTSAGNLKLVNKALGTTLALSTPSSSSGNGANLKMVTYTNDTVYIDEWQLFENVSFGDLAIDIDDTVTANIITDCSVNLINVSDYTYTITAGSSYISIDNNTGIISGEDYANLIAPGVATITATHKVSGISKSFNVKVYAGFVVMTIFSSFEEGSIGGDGHTINSGHTFLIFYNNTKSPITVGYVSVSPETEMSIGKFGVEKHKGIWYNRELYDMQTDSSYYDDRVSLTSTITLSDLESINNDYIFGNDDYNLASDNCSTFALDIWNDFTDWDLPRFLADTPNDVKCEIVKKSFYEEGRITQLTQYYGYYDSKTGKIICVWGSINDK